LQFNQGRMLIYIYIYNQRNTAMPNSALLTRAQRADLYKSHIQATLTQAKQRNETEAKNMA
jgi:hypothetical protein